MKLLLVNVVLYLVYHLHTAYPRDTRDTRDTTQCYIKRNRMMAEYSGTVHVTESGTICDHWTNRYNRSNNHLFPYDGSVKAAKNYCRDPDKFGFLWCYTLAANRTWKMCNVPKCAECYKKVNRKAEYQGMKRVTASGITCQRWDEFSPHYHGYTSNSRFPELDIHDAENFCRDPDSSGFPWCYTTSSSKWEKCGIPRCET